MLHAVRRGATYLCLRLVRASVSDKLRFHAFFIINLIQEPDHQIYSYEKECFHLMFDVNHYFFL